MKRKDVPIQIDKLIQDTFEEPCEEKFDDLFHKLENETLSFYSCQILLKNLCVYNDTHEEGMYYSNLASFVFLKFKLFFDKNSIRELADSNFIELRSIPFFMENLAEIAHLSSCSLLADQMNAFLEIQLKKMNHSQTKSEKLNVSSILKMVNGISRLVGSNKIEGKIDANLIYWCFEVLRNCNADYFSIKKAFSLSLILMSSDEQDKLRLYLDERVNTINKIFSQKEIKDDEFLKLISFLEKENNLVFDNFCDLLLNCSTYDLKNKNKHSIHFPRLVQLIFSKLSILLDQCLVRKYIQSYKEPVGMIFKLKNMSNVIHQIGTLSYLAPNYFSKKYINFMVEEIAIYINILYDSKRNLTFVF